MRNLFRPDCAATSCQFGDQSSGPCAGRIGRSDSGVHVKFQTNGGFSVIEMIQILAINEKAIHMDGKLTL